jgi:hypothetical protein
MKGSPCRAAYFLKTRFSKATPVAERIERDVELLEDVLVADRVQHHAVLDQPDERAERELRADGREPATDGIEIALDDAEVDRQTRIVEVRVVLVEAGRESQLVVRLGPFAAGDIGGERERHEAARELGEARCGAQPLRRHVDHRRRPGLRPLGHLLDHAPQIELVGALVVDDEVGTERQDLGQYLGREVARRGAFAAGIQGLEAHAKPPRLGPAVEPVADELGVREGYVMAVDRGRGADEDDTDRAGLARHLDGRAAPTDLVGHEAERRGGGS